MSDYSLGNAPGKPHVVYGPDGERLGVYRIKYDGTNPLAIVRKNQGVAVSPNPNRLRQGTFVTANPDLFRKLC